MSGWMYPVGNLDLLKLTMERHFLGSFCSYKLWPRIQVVPWHYKSLLAELNDGKKEV